MYCFVGWCIETTYVSLNARQFVNRGFLYGPVIPIYGCGAIAILFSTIPVREWTIAVFLVGMLAASVLEYVTGVLMERIFKVRYWDYTDNKFNINGHVSLGTSLAWGGLSVVLVKWIHKPFERVVYAIPEATAQALAFVLMCVFIFDLAVSLRAALDLRALLEQMQEQVEHAKEDVRLLQKRFDVYSAFKTADWEEKLSHNENLRHVLASMEQTMERLENSETTQKLRYDLALFKERRAAKTEAIAKRLTRDKKFLLRNNPNAKSRHYAVPLKALRERINEEREARKKK